MLFGKGLDRLLLRKTCGAGGRSNKAGRRLVNDFSAGCFDTVANGETGDVVAFTEYGDLLTFEH